jgi:dual specificity protein kinase YAK1
MGTNEDFDLPRWQSQSHLEPLSSSAQAAHSANAQSSYLYSAPPPPSAPAGPSPATRVPQSQQASASSRQQARISQLLEENHALASQPQYGQSTQLGRSASFSTAAGRARRHHQPDDLEGAFASDNQATLRQNSLGGASQHPNPYYPPAVAYHQSTPSPNPGPSPAGDMYYNGASGDLASKQRPHNAHDSSQSLRSPLRTTTSTTQTTLLDPYSQQFQYSPSTTAYSYNAPSGASYPTHSRSNSQQTKNEPLTPPLSYSPMQTQPTNNSYSTPTYTTEAAPQHHAGSQSQPHLTARPLQRHSSTSTPSTPSYAHSANSVHSAQTSTTSTTPLSYSHSAQTSSSHYYPQDQPMGVDASPPRQRRVSGFIRVRDARDLRPFVNPQPPGRRMDSHGVYLSASLLDCPCL